MGGNGVSFGYNSLENEGIAFGVSSENKEGCFCVMLFERVENFGGLDWIWSVVECESEKFLSCFDAGGYGLTGVLRRDRGLFGKDKKSDGQQEGGGHFLVTTPSRTRNFWLAVGSRTIVISALPCVPVPSRRTMIFGGLSLFDRTVLNFPV